MDCAERSEPPVSLKIQLLKERSKNQKDFLGHYFHGWWSSTHVVRSFHPPLLCTSKTSQRSLRFNWAFYHGHETFFFTLWVESLRLWSSYTSLSTCSFLKFKNFFIIVNAVSNALPLPATVLKNNTLKSPLNPQISQAFDNNRISV